jgi:peptidylprolyl isomerase
LRTLLTLCLLLTSSCALFTPMPAPPVPWMTESGIVITDLVKPKGDGVLVGQDVSVHYRAKLRTGVEFDSSYDQGKAIAFTAGLGQVPAGFDEGVLGMRLGGQREAIVPPELAYGEAGIPGLVPPDAAITFYLELMTMGPVPPLPPTPLSTAPGVQPKDFSGN